MNLDSGPVSASFVALNLILSRPSPPLHHLDSLLPVLAAGVGAPDIVLLDMGKLACDRIRIPHAAFFEQS